MKWINALLFIFLLSLALNSHAQVSEPRDGDLRKLDSIEQVVPLPPDKSFKFDEQNAHYPGGDKAMIKFLSRNIKYPPEAKQLKAEGKVFVKFLVNADGKISDIKIVKGLRPDCDAEVIRVVGLMPRWKPAKQLGKTVSTYFTLPVVFKLK